MIIVVLLVVIEGGIEFKKPTPSVQVHLDSS